ncbi:MAG: amidohydrolase family protein [Erysipelotrichales bacterium]|nr:amidohydrolase family protein [Erysipelotrichales bacterium]
MSSYLLKNCDIANFDTLGVSRKDLLITGERIALIRDRILPEEHPDAEVIDVNGKLVMPSFADMHTHMMQTFLKGPMDDYPITDWLVRLFSIGDLFDEETAYYSALLGCLSSLRFGTTTINEMADWIHFAPILKAFEDSGIRAVIGISTTDIAENDKTPLISVEEALYRSEYVYDHAHGKNNGLIEASCAPAGLPACSKKLVQALKQFADHRGIIFHTHLAEGRKETEDVRRMYNLSGEGEALYQFGILGPKTVLAHNIWLSDAELDRIKETGANPVHCPNTNLKISDGIAPFAAMQKKGINVCFGCDGEASSSTRDMIREGRMGAYLQKGVTLDPTVFDAGYVFKAMTKNGPKALGYTDLGEIKEGNLADLIIVDMTDDLSLVNRDYRIGNLLYAGDGHAVDTVFTAGKIMVRGKHLTMFDEGKIIETSERLLRKLNDKIRKAGL